MGRFKVLTPKTSFPIRGDPKRLEAAIQKTNTFSGLYDWQSKRKERDAFVIHDGPPYANGPAHMGHALNKILKDFINRYKLLKGYRLSYRPGWDCHGLPIEQKALKDISFNTHPLTVRKVACDYAKKAIKTQERAFRSWGLLGDWGNPYLTMSKEYESNQTDVFYRMYEQGCIYRSFKPVYWSPSSCTTLAEAELEYKDHTSPSVYVKFPSRFPQLLEGKVVHSLVWTTTPWTLPGNKAICYNPLHSYCLIKQSSSEDVLLIGNEVLEELNHILGEYSILHSFNGAALSDGVYTNPINNNDDEWFPFLPASHVSSQDGTGLVHTAPAHGFDDYTVAKKHNLNLTSLVDETGCYDNDRVSAELAGLDVFTTGNKKIISLLETSGSLLHYLPYNHRYPHDWRTKKPVIIRSTKQWFASMDAIREGAVQALGRVRGVPQHSITRLLDMVSNRLDWCISRQRVWGLPIPVFYRHGNPDDYLMTRETVDHIRMLFRQHGSDAWWTLPTAKLLPPSLSKEAESYERGQDTLDVWFDSGSSWATVIEGGVADMYVEGHDQCRGWFQSSLLTSVSLTGTSPYRTLVCHGFVLDGKGDKMSKSLGNVLDPETLINDKRLGVDGLRLLIASSDFTTDINISEAFIDSTAEMLLKIRNTLRFMIGNLSSFTPQTDLVPYSSLPPLERYMLHVLSEYFSSVESLYEELKFSKICHLLDELFRFDLSSFYYEVVKDPLYCDQEKSDKRRNILTVLYHFLRYLTVSLGPLLPHLVEEINQHYPLGEGE